MVLEEQGSPGQVCSCSLLGYFICYFRVTFNCSVPCFAMRIFLSDLCLNTMSPLKYMGLGLAVSQVIRLISFRLVRSRSQVACNGSSEGGAPCMISEV